VRAKYRRVTINASGTYSNHCGLRVKISRKYTIANICECSESTSFLQPNRLLDTVCPQQAAPASPSALDESCAISINSELHFIDFCCGTKSISRKPWPVATPTLKKLIVTEFEPVDILSTYLCHCYYSFYTTLHGKSLLFLLITRHTTRVSNFKGEISLKFRY
jgi:hypothetical protein